MLAGWMPLLFTLATPFVSYAVLRVIMTGEGPEHQPMIGIVCMFMGWVAGMLWLLVNTSNKRE